MVYTQIRSLVHVARSKKIGTSPRFTIWGYAVPDFRQANIRWEYGNYLQCHSI